MTAKGLKAQQTDAKLQKESGKTPPPAGCVAVQLVELSVGGVYLWKESADTPFQFAFTSTTKTATYDLSQKLVDELMAKIKLISNPKDANRVSALIASALYLNARAPTQTADDQGLMEYATRLTANTLVQLMEDDEPEQLANLTKIALSESNASAVVSCLAQRADNWLIELHARPRQKEGLSEELKAYHIPSIAALFQTLLKVKLAPENTPTPANAKKKDIELSIIPYQPDTANGKGKQPITENTKYKELLKNVKSLMKNTSLIKMLRRYLKNFFGKEADLDAKKEAELLHKLLILFEHSETPVPKAEQIFAATIALIMRYKGLFSKDGVFSYRSPKSQDANLLNNLNTFVAVQNLQARIGRNRKANKQERTIDWSRRRYAAELSKLSLLLNAIETLESPGAKTVQAILAKALSDAPSTHREVDFHDIFEPKENTMLPDSMTLLRAIKEGKLLQFYVPVMPTRLLKLRSNDAFAYALLQLKGELDADSTMRKAQQLVQDVAQVTNVNLEAFSDIGCYNGIIDDRLRAAEQTIFDAAQTLIPSEDAQKAAILSGLSRFYDPTDRRFELWFSDQSFPKPERKRPAAPSVSPLQESTSTFSADTPASTLQKSTTTLNVQDTTSAFGAFCRP